MKRLVIPSVISILLVVFIVFALQSLSSLVKHNQALLAMNEKIAAINAKDVHKLKTRQIEILEQKKLIAEQHREIIRQKKVQVIFKHYRDSGTMYNYPWVTPKHLYNVIMYRERYAEFSKVFNYDTLDAENFFLAWVANESSFNPNCKYVNKRNGKIISVDLGITQMNECNWYIIKLLPIDEKIKKRGILDTELNIAVWHYWMGIQEGYPVWRIWKKFREDARLLYFKLNEVRG